jgi:hypothetical protein
VLGAEPATRSADAPVLLAVGTALRGRPRGRGAGAVMVAPVVVDDWLIAGGTDVSMVVVVFTADPPSCWDA